MNIFKNVKNILGFILKAALCIAVLCVVAIIVLLPKYKDEEYHSAPFAMVKEEQEIIRNAVASYDFYLSIKQGEKQYSAIYNFDVWAGVDFRQELPEKLNNSSYMLPYPHILSVDQNDSERPFVLKEKGDLEYNTDVKPAKEAMEKMAVDCARRSDLLERSADNMLDYIRSMDTVYSYCRAEKPDVEECVLEFPHLPAYISCFPDLLTHATCYVVDTNLYQRCEFLSLSETGDPVFTISYDFYSSWSYDDINNWIDEKSKGQEWKSIRVVDPINPNEKIVAMSNDEAYMYMDGFMYHAQSWVQNDENFYRDYMPDMLYLLFCMHPDKGRVIDRNYIEWVEQYDECIDNINSARWSSAYSNLANLYSLQHDSLNYNEEYMFSLVTVAGGYEPSGVSNDEKYNNLLYGYCDMFSSKSKNALQNNGNFRRDLLNLVRGMQMEGLDEELERFYCLYCDCEEFEKDDYISDIIQKGQVIDKELINEMSPDQFLEFYTNLIYNTIREVGGENYSIDDIKAGFPEEYDNRNDSFPIKLIRGTWWQEDEFGAKEDIVDRLDEISYRKYETELKDYGPILIYLYKQDRNIIGTRRDAVVFAYNGLFYVADYLGRNRKDAKQDLKLYKDIRISKNGEIPFGGWECKDPVVVGLVQRIKDAYNNNGKSYRKELESALRNAIVNEAANHILTVGDRKIDPDIVNRFK